MSALRALDVESGEHGGYGERGESGESGDGRGSRPAPAGGAPTGGAVVTDDLVERARSGDLEAFERLVHLTSPACYALALRLVGNEHDARDVMQDTYLRAFRGLRKFRGDAAFTTWLHRITVNCAASHLERRSKANHADLDDVGDSRSLTDQVPERDPEAVASRSDERERLLEALGALPDRLRVVVVLRDVYDLSHKDIAKQLGISQAAAKVRLHRARRQLQELLYTGRRSPTEEAAADSDPSESADEDGPAPDETAQAQVR